VTDGYLSGKLLNVDIDTMGDELTADAATGATTLQVDDAKDFDEDGGQLLLNGTVYTYLTVDDDAGTIALAEPLAADAQDGDDVQVWDAQYNDVSQVMTADVELHAADGGGDPIHAVVAEHLVKNLSEGPRGIDAETVLLRRDHDEWRIEDILGRPESALGTKFYEDAITVTATGDQTIPLTFTPIEHSEHLYWNGLYQQGSEWSRDGRTVTVPDSGTLIAVGDVLTVEYAYRAGMAPPPDAELEVTHSFPLLDSWWTTTGYGVDDLVEHVPTDQTVDIFSDGNPATYIKYARAHWAGGWAEGDTESWSYIDNQPVSLGAGNEVRVVTDVHGTSPMTVQLLKNWTGFGGILLMWGDINQPLDSPPAGQTAILQLQTGVTWDDVSAALTSGDDLVVTFSASGLGVGETAQTAIISTAVLQIFG
jgi:hypothetical protein